MCVLLCTFMSDPWYCYIHTLSFLHLNRNYVFLHIYNSLPNKFNSTQTQLNPQNVASWACYWTINTKMANHSDVVECSFEVLVSWRQGSWKPDSMTTFKNSVTRPSLI